MFVSREDWKPFELRQGDVLVAIPFPFVSHTNTSLLGQIPPGEHELFPSIQAVLRPHRDRDDVSYFTGQVTMKLCPCIVVTQCCELRPNEKNKLREVAAITVCRLMPVKGSILKDREKLTSLQENRDPRVQGGPKLYKNFFWVGTADGLTEAPLMADFSQMACIPNSEFPEIMDRKHAQMTDRERMKLKIKLGVFFAKPTDEEIEAGILNPWANEDTTERTIGDVAPATIGEMPQPPNEAAERP